jgi:hypothetical protein
LCITRADIDATLDDTIIDWSGETTYDMSTGDGINWSISSSAILRIKTEA